MPFKEDLDRCPIDVVRLHYGGWPYGSQSIISTVVSVPAAVTTLPELLAAVVTTETAEVIEESLTDVLTYSGTVAPHEYMEIDPGTFNVTFTRSAGAVVLLDQGDGTLAVGSDTGTIDYTTGEWTITLDTTPDNAEDITATYDWFYVVPSTTTITGLWMTPAVTTEIYATYSEEGVPTASTGTLISEPVFLEGQPDLVANAKFFGAVTDMSIEVLV